MFRSLFLFKIIISVIIFIKVNTEKENIFYKCGKNNLKIKPKILKTGIPVDQNNTIFKRRLDPDGFKNFSIYIDLTNIEKEIQKYNLARYRNLFYSSFEKAIKTLQSLLKVKPLLYQYYFSDDSLEDMGIDYWDKTKFGSQAASKGITNYKLGRDLVIFGKFLGQEEMGKNTLASATMYHYEKETGLPISGYVNINKDLDYSKIQSQEYFDSIILHEFTHILGFDYYIFYNLNIILKKTDKFGIQRYYINSPKVKNLGKKYFNCENIDGVELEEFGGSGTAGSHWESRILLGDYMNGAIYTEEQVISEFTLALLEDIGLYKANYYTGGLMRYGKNKGCDFLYEKCINDDEINPNFENEFFDYYISSFYPSCSSGRQSRTYNLLYIYDNISEEYQYYQNSSYGGLSMSDFCPIPTTDMEEKKYFGYYVGHCSSKGNGYYGYFIEYFDQEKNETFYYQSKEIQSIIGEKYSYNSFCYLSSLIKNTKSNYEFYSNTVRSVCFETYCSSKSLTVKINNDYIVCPREGGKIKVNSYEGYLLCPDYNLMCSGTVLCNDMFDCVDKKSQIKENAYDYDYKIKTSQNIPKAELEEPDLINNYELSDDGKCPKFCKLCQGNQICIECKDNYLFAGKVNEEKIGCVESSKINIGYYKYNDIYYECLENCDVCNNSYVCDSCNNDSLPLFDKCIKKIENCDEYNENGSCKKCNYNYALIENDLYHCKKIESLAEYYTKDEGISYFKCDGEGANHIKNCKKCHYNEKIECDECININYNLENNQCKDKNNNSNYYYIKVLFIITFLFLFL